MSTVCSLCYVRLYLWLFPILDSRAVSPWSLLTFTFVKNRIQTKCEFHDLNMDFVV